MDQPTDAEKPCLNDGPGTIEVIETSRAFFRPDIVTVSPVSAAICSTPHGPASTVFRYVTPLGLTHEDAASL
jgi:hypothetical protein